MLQAPGLIFLDKTFTLRVEFHGELRLGREWLAVTNALAYSAAVLITVKSFIVPALRHIHRFSFFLITAFTKIWGMYYKTSYGRNLRIYVISKSVCLWQAFTA
jgi:hypothetical protein